MSEDDASAWERTRTEVEAMAEELAADGWSVTTLFADHATALGPGTDHVDPYGLVYTVPDDEAAALADAFPPEAAVEWTTFHSGGGSPVVLVTRLTNPDAGTAALLAGAFDRSDLFGVRRHATEAGAVYTHVRTIDGTVVRAFEHDDPDPFFPD